MARTIKVSGKVEELTDLSLESLQKQVGGYIEMVTLPNGQTMIVNEDGIAKDLSPNLKASRLAGQVIRGHVVLCNKGELV